MSSHLVVKRLQNAMRAMNAARNEEFRKYWFGVYEKLLDQAYGS